jgi:hypothetical protein
VTVVAAASTASQIEPGALGFLIVAGMGLALFFLFRSLNKQLHKITPDPPSRQGPRPPGPKIPAAVQFPDSDKNH